MSLNPFVTHQARQFYLFAFIFIAFIVVWHKHSCVNFESAECKGLQTEEKNKYISSLCNCGKEIIMASESMQSQPDAFKWCGDESSIRGKQQKIITYTLYGNVDNALFAQRYYSLLQNISLTAERDYPGK